MLDDDINFIKEVEDEERRLYYLKLPSEKKVGWEGMTQMLDIALKHPKLAEILGSEIEEIDNPQIQEILFPESSEEERKAKTARFFNLLSIFFKADLDPDEWLKSKEAGEFEEYLLHFKHIIKEHRIEG